MIIHQEQPTGNPGQSLEGEQSNNGQLDHNHRSNNKPGEDHSQLPTISGNAESITNHQDSQGSFVRDLLHLRHRSHSVGPSHTGGNESLPIIEMKELNQTKQKHHNHHYHPGEFVRDLLHRSHSVGPSSARNDENPPTQMKDPEATNQHQRHRHHSKSQSFRKLLHLRHRSHTVGASHIGGSNESLPTEMEDKGPTNHQQYQPQQHHHNHHHHHPGKHIRGLFHLGRDNLKRTQSDSGLNRFVNFLNSFIIATICHTCADLEVWHDYCLEFLVIKLLSFTKKNTLSTILFCCVVRVMC